MMGLVLGLISRTLILFIDPTMRMRVRIEFVGLIILFGIVLQSAESWNNENSKDDRNGIHDSGIGSCVISSLS
jgi:hypothetical protein